MQTNERAWHIKQAKALNTYRRDWNLISRDLSIAYWEIGERLNKVYGYTEGPGRGAGTITVEDYEDLEDIYNVGQGTLGQARRWHKLFPNKTNRNSALAEDPLWRNHIYTANGAVKAPSVNFPAPLFELVATDLGSPEEARAAVRWYIHNRLSAQTIVNAYQKFQANRRDLMLTH